MWLMQGDGSVVDENGKVVFFSTHRFINDICLGNCCFICGADPESKYFNHEHILPEWLLRKYDLFSKTVVLPNGASVCYGKYTIPCCADCNSLMGREIEEPISKVISGGVESINNFIVNGNLLKMYVWMALIYLKIHLRDRDFRLNLDYREGGGKIADQYDWDTLHHIHSVIRCFFTGCSVEIEAIGSFLGIPVNAQASLDQFDFGDLYLAQTMFLRLDDTAMIAVFNDSGGAMNYFSKTLEKITGPVSELQLREIMVELAFLNLHLRERPLFYTDIDLDEKTCRIIGKRPELGLLDMDMRVRGGLLFNAVKHALPNIIVPGKTTAEVSEAIRSGELSFLFDDKGEFIQESWRPL